MSFVPRKSAIKDLSEKVTKTTKTFLDILECKKLLALMFRISQIPINVIEKSCYVVAFNIKTCIILCLQQYHDDIK